MAKLQNSSFSRYQQPNSSQNLVRKLPPTCNVCFVMFMRCLRPCFWAILVRIALLSFCTAGGSIQKILQVMNSKMPMSSFISILDIIHQREAKQVKAEQHLEKL